MTPPCKWLRNRQRPLESRPKGLLKLETPQRVVAAMIEWLVANDWEWVITMMVLDILDQAGETDG